MNSNSEDATGTTLDVPTPDELRPILTAVRRLRTRVRVQRGLRAAIYAIAASALGLATLVLLHALWVLPPDLWDLALLVPAALTGAALLVALCWPVDALRSAASLDASNDLKDRLGTALSLMRGGGARSPFQAAQLRDAARHARDAQAGKAAPWRFPREVAWVVVGIAGAWALTLLRLPAPEQTSEALRPHYLGDSTGALSMLPPTLPPDPERDLAVPPEQHDAIQQELKELAEKVAEETKDVSPAEDSTAAAAMAELEAIIDDLAHERIDDREATKRMAELDEKLEAMNEQTPEQAQAADAQDAALEQAGEELKEALKDTALTEPEVKEKLEQLAKELEEKKFEEASKTLQDLMEKFLKLPKKDQERLAKMFEHLAKKFQSPLQKELDKLKKERDRLAKKSEEGAGGQSKKDKDRLNKLNRQLEQLGRKQDSSPDEKKKRELDKLGRDMRDLADQLRRQKEQEEKEKQEQAGNKPEEENKRPEPQDKKSMEEMRKMLEEMKKQTQRQRLGQKTKMKMADVKELMKARKGMGPGQRRELEKLARGGKGGQKGGQGTQPTPGGPKPGADWRKTAKGMETEWKELAPQGGAGAAKAAMLGGPETDLVAKTEDDFLNGQMGEGESHRLVLKGAAAKGTGVKGYGELQIDYSMRAARQMQDEEIPPGYRQYVEEYFRLIRER